VRQVRVWVANGHEEREGEDPSRFCITGA